MLFLHSLTLFENSKFEGVLNSKFQNSKYSNFYTVAGKIVQQSLTWLVNSQDIFFFFQRWHDSLVLVYIVEILCHVPGIWDMIPTKTPIVVVDLVLVSSLLFLNRFHTWLWCFHCWLWTNNNRLWIDRNCAIITKNFLFHWFDKKKQNVTSNPFQPYLSRSEWWCVFCLFTPYLSVFLVFLRKNLILLNLIDKYATSTSH